MIALALRFILDADTSKLDTGLKDAEKQAQQVEKAVADADKKAGELGAEDFRKLLDGLKKADIVAGKSGQTLSKTDQQAKALGDKMIGLIKNLAQLYIGTKAIETFKAITLETAEQNVQLGKQANALGMNVERMQQWQGAFEAAGSSGQAFTGLFEKLKTQTRDPEAAILRMADTMKGMGKAQQTRYGKWIGLDQEAIDLLAKGSKGVQEYLAKEKELGLVTKDDIEQSKKFNEQKRITGRLMDDVKGKIAMTLLPAFKWMLEGFQKFIRFMREHAPFAKAFFIGLAAGILALYLPAVVAAAAATWAWLAPFLLIGAAVALIALIADDIITYFEGGDSMLGRWAKKFPIIDTLLQGIKGLFTDLIAIIMDDIIPAVGQFGEFMGKVLGDVGEGIGHLYDWAVEFVSYLIEGAVSIGTAFGSAIDSITGAFSAMYEFVKGILGWILDKVGAVGKFIGGLFGGGEDGKAGKSVLAENMQKGQQVLAATNSPLVSQTSNVTNTQNTANNQKGPVSKTTSLKVDQITVQTQATDANGIAKGINDAIGSQMRNASAQFDDCIAR